MPLRRGEGGGLWPVILGVVVLGAFAVGVTVWALTDSSDDDPGQAGGETAGVASDFAVDLAERWGQAMESGDAATVRALYRSEADEGATIVDRFYRAVWTDGDAAIDAIIRSNDFVRVEPVRVEEFWSQEPNRPGSGLIVAEYEVEVAAEESGEEPGAPMTVVVVFHQLGDDGEIGATDIYFPYFSSFVTGEVGGYPQRTEENEDNWVIID